MLNSSDLSLILSKGITESEILLQREKFEKGAPFLQIIKPAVVGDGIILLSSEMAKEFEDYYMTQLANLQIVKFVPASGAATRMFETFYEYLDAEIVSNEEAELLSKGYGSISKFVSDFDKFAFSKDLKQKLNELGKSFETCVAEKDFKFIIKALIDASGLNYGNLPKGLLKFHSYLDQIRTPMEEHMVEGAYYGKDKDNRVQLHFTVSEEHFGAFESLFSQVKEVYEKKFGVSFEISFSTQKLSTDTISVDLQNEFFRDKSNQLVFRPGGHGALIENLNEIDADLIFIKNIDNVVPDRMKDETYHYKSALAGILLKYQKKIFEYLHKLEDVQYKVKDLLIEEIGGFILNELFTLPSDLFEPKTKAEKLSYLYNKLNRPIRVCGMVKNAGEPGGGPFWVVNQDRTVSLQIVESAQIDMSNPEQAEFMKISTHFNPVDLVVGVRNYKGEKFELPKFVDNDTYFISKKSKDGKDLKALELPGLWNGSMSDWITIFVEVPISTFNPVKTVMDLIRPEHIA